MSATLITGADHAGCSALRLRVSEVFGPTFQGEGASCGQRAMFVRLSGCNASCGWCDTPYTWDATRFDLTAETQTMSVDEVSQRVLAETPGLVIVTGGEPMIQHRPLLALVQRLHASGRRVEIETNGTIPPPPRLAAVVSRFTVSPKLSNAGMPASQSIRPAVLQTFVDAGNAVFKFVVAGAEDLDEVSGLEAALGLAPIWIMPEATDPDRLTAQLRVLADPVLSRGWNLTSRLHIALWGDCRGR